MFCKYCGKEIDNGAAFCYHCGAQLGNNDEMADTTVLTPEDYRNPMGGSAYTPPQQRGNAYKPPVQPQNPYAQPQQIYAQPAPAQQAYNQPAQPYVQPIAAPAPAKKKGLSKGAIAAIVGGVIIALAIIGGVAEKLLQNAGSFGEKPISFGVIEDGVYKNSYLGMTVTPQSENWVYKTKDEIYESYSKDNTVVYDREAGTVYMDEPAGETYYDMVLVNQKTGSNIQVMIMDIADNIVYSKSDCERDLEKGIAGVYDDYKIEPFKVMSIGGYNYDVKKITVSYLGHEVTQYYGIAEIDSNIAMFCVTSVEFDFDNHLDVFGDLIEE